MKKVSKTVFVFSILIVAGLFICVLLSRFVIDSGNYYSLNKKYTAIVLGHSQTECALNDSLIHNTKNLSQGGESYFYTYLKLKKILEVNKQVNTIYLSYSNNQIDKGMDNWIWGEDKMTNFFPKYSFLMDIDEYKLFLSKNLPLLLKCERLALHKNVLFFLRGGNVTENGDWGGYLHLKRNKLNDKRNFSNQPKGLSTVNISYLQKIISLAKEKNIKIYLIRTPIYPKDPFLKNEKSFVEIRKKYFASIPFIDFKDFPLKDDEFGDFIHVNYKGAKKISDSLSRLIDKGRLEANLP